MIYLVCAVTGIVVVIESIAVFGATGRTGQCVVAAALARDWRVRALCRPGRRPSLSDPRLIVVEGELAPDGRANALQWSRPLSDSASAAYAQDSLAALIAPGQTQLACALDQYSRSTFAVTLLAVGNVLVTFELRGTSLGEAGYVLDLRTDRLDPTIARFRCVHPLGPLH